MARICTVVLFVAFFLSGCEKGAGQAVFVPPDAGLIRNQAFTVDDKNKISSWRLTQHATRDSYRMSSEGGVLSLIRTGKEPWGAVKQAIKRKELSGFAGRTLEFSADVSGVYTDEYGEPMHDPGLAVLVQGFPRGANRMLGARTLLTEKVSVLSGSDGADWARYKLRFVVPGGEGLMLTKLELSFVMTSGGAMKVRGPALTVVE